MGTIPLCNARKINLMARVNKSSPKPAVFNHEGARAVAHTPLNELKRAVSSCFLWERNFYESGEDIAARIERLVGEVLQTGNTSGNPLYVPARNIGVIAELAVNARSTMNLRHVPLLLLVSMVKHGGSPSRETYNAVIQRPDEMGELIAMLWKDGKRPIPKQMKLGIADAFRKFSAYSLAKYNRKGDAISLTDVLRIVHPKPETPQQDTLFASIVEGTLESPDTWEVALSSGADKKATFERLLSENKMGSLALLRNLRNMEQAGVDRELVASAIASVDHGRTLPFRFVAAARHAPGFEPYLDAALVKSIEALPVLPGRTVVLVDVSGSMNSALSAKSDMSRMDAAATLGSMIGGDRRLFTFSSRIIEVAPRLGMAGVDAIRNSQQHSMTDLRGAITYLNDNVPHDRLIVITDEQTQTRAPAPKAERAYLIDVAGHQNGVNYHDWISISGFSESVLKFIWEMENN